MTQTSNQHSHGPAGNQRHIPVGGHNHPPVVGHVQQHGGARPTQQQTHAHSGWFAFFSPTPMNSPNPHVTVAVVHPPHHSSAHNHHGHR